MTTADKIFIIVDKKRISLAAFMAMDKSKVRTVDASGCTALTELKADAAEYVDASGCTALTELKADAAKTVDARGCTALTELKAPADANIDRNPEYICAGADSRGYLFEGVTVRSQWRVIAGCQNKLIKDARKHWGPGGDSDRPDCLALVEKIAAYAETQTRGYNVGEQVDA